MTDGVMWGEDSGFRLVSGECRSAPTSHEEGVLVRVPSFDAGADRFGPCAFTPIPTAGGPIFPSIGDLCLVGFDENNEAWVLVFVPGG